MSLRVFECLRSGESGIAIRRSLRWGMGYSLGGSYQCRQLGRVG